MTPSQTPRRGRSSKLTLSRLTDARALGSGRPFILELKRPHVRTLPFDRLEEEVNRSGAGRVEVEGLARAGADDAARYKAADPSKTYHARCEADGPIDKARLEEALAGLVGLLVGRGGAFVGEAPRPEANPCPDGEARSGSMADAQHTM